MAEWEKYTLGNSPLEIIDGDRGKNYPSQDDFKSEGYCLFLSTKNVRESGFDFSDCSFVSKEKDELLRKGKLKRYDTVLTTRGTIGNLGFYNRNVPFENIRINSGMVIIRPNISELDPIYCFYIFRGFQKDFESFTSGTAQPQLPIKDLNHIPLSLPPLPEQQSIAAVLSSLDDKIDLLRRQNKTLEALAETLFRQWFVEGAEEGVKGKIGDYVRVQGGYAFKSKDFLEYGYAAVLKITNISMGIINITKTQFVNEDIVEIIDETKFRIKSGDFLIAMTGAEIGKIGMVENTERQLWLNQRVARLIAKVNFGDLIGYLAYKSREGQDYIVNSASGSAQENISSSDLENMEFIQCSEEKTSQLGGKIKPFFEKMKSNLYQIQILTRLRDMLLPKLMSGEVRVREEGT